MTYADWVAHYDTLTAERRSELRRAIRQLEYQPLISILLPIYNPDLKLLEELATSLAALPPVDAVLYDVTNKPPATIELE